MYCSAGYHWVELGLAWLVLCSVLFCGLDWRYTLGVGVWCIHILCELIERIKIPYLSQIGSGIPGLIMILASFG
jgi:hypothetical protein